MIGATEDSDDLMLFMLCFGDSKVRVFLLEVVRIDEGGFVTQELFAGTEMLGKYLLDFLLKNMLVLVADRVPELGLALVNEVYP